jgi:hypothetical protein
VHFVFVADDQHAALQGVVDASNYHDDTFRRSISSSSQSKTTSAGIKVSVTHQIIPSRVAIRYGVMVVSFVVLGRRQPRRHD